MLYVKAETDSEESDDVNFESEPILHTEGTCTLKVTLHYTNQHEKAMPTYAMFMKC